ncbi:diphthine synthase [Candidatus Woesearchaeota archaeon]|nr:diphthine synthase [Candidatus Woesearchaeota archaeon]
MTLFLIGIGLEEEDISLKAITSLKLCKKIYLESYTSTGVSKEYLEKLLKKSIESKDREFFENESKKIILKAKKENIALLIQGDCLSATTHISILQEAIENKVKTEIIHGISIFTAISETGLSLYNFGKTTSIPFNNKNIKTPYEVVKSNLEKEMHTLILLDLNPKENKFLTANEGLKYLISQNLDENKEAVICSKLGTSKKEIKKGKIKDLINTKLKYFPQCIIIPGKMHFVEEEFLNKWKN